MDAHLNLHYIHDSVLELRHEININNLNIGIHWKQRLQARQQKLKQNQKIIINK